MMNKNYTIKEYTAVMDERLKKAFPGEKDIVTEAMSYSLEAGGKRIRPVLTLEFCRLCGGDITEALPLAEAVEMVHTYSLIHDDLPCMDDDDMRRGRPSCHKQFGEAYALLAGDGLLTYAFYNIADSEFAKKNPSAAVKAVKILSECAGKDGMIGGQTIDLLSENKSISEEELRHMDALKTGMLIKAAALLGCVAAGADEDKMKAAEEFCDNLGLAFQVVDDILDVEGDESLFGKPVGSDAQSGKSTYVTLMGLEKAKQLAAALTSNAVNALIPFGEQAAFLKELALSLLTRKN
ncbi:MAG: polyprenyl synthetase family protein [Clostridia bacterium]|nr:polyprenyl synthetase family protein [Clostridia bacterium]